MLEHGWSVKDTQAAVERVKSVFAARPATLDSIEALAYAPVSGRFVRILTKQSRNPCFATQPTVANITGLTRIYGN